MEKLDISKKSFYKKKLIMFFSILGVYLLIPPQPIISLETFPRDNDHRGIVQINSYQIYPENRIGNGIYTNKKLQDTFIRNHKSFKRHRVYNFISYYDATEPLWNF